MEEEIQNHQQQPQNDTQEEQPTSRIVTDGVSDLQNLTRILISRMGDLVEHVLLKSSEVKEEGSGNTFQVEEEVDKRVTGIIDDIHTFEAIVNEMEEFSKTEQQQVDEIAALSNENHLVTETLRTKLHEYQSIQQSLSSLLDNTLDQLT